MKKKILSILLIVLSAVCLLCVGACNKGGNPGPVANAELDEYNQIVSQMKEAFSPEQTQSQALAGANVYTNQYAFIEQESEIEAMFDLMEAEPKKKVSQDMDYYAYGIDFSTMTARIAGYAANNFFSLGTFYNVNVLMDYGADTLINACVKKDGDVIKTYLFTQYEDSFSGTQKEYNYTEIKFTSQTDFKLIVVDYTYDEQDNLVSSTMIYASNNKDFFLISGMANETDSAIVFFDKGVNEDSYIIEGKDLNTIYTLYGKMQDKFALSQNDKSFIASLYNTQQYSVTFAQVMEAKTALGIIIDLEEEIQNPIGFISNKNAEDLMGRKTLQAFVDDGESVVGTTLTIPSEFNYLSGGIYFDANIDTLVIPSSIRGVVVYDRTWNYSLLDDSLCYYDAGDNYDDGGYRNWGGTLISYVSGQDGFNINKARPFKKFILLDDNGLQTTETDAFLLDEIGNLWIKDSNGNKNYLWGFVSEPNLNKDTLYIPSPTVVTKDRTLLVEHFACDQFLDAMRNVGKLDEYVAKFKHIIIDAYVLENPIPEMGINAGVKLVDTNLLKSFNVPSGEIYGCKWDLETFTINKIPDGATIRLNDVFCSEFADYVGDPNHRPYTICQVKIDKVILNGDFDTITYNNGFYDIDWEQIMGGGMMMPGMGIQIDAIHAIGNETILNGRENAKFTYDSVIYGQKVVEYYGDNSIPCYPSVERFIVKDSVRTLNLYNSLLKIGEYDLPADRKVTIEFENIAGLDYGMSYIYDFMSPNASASRIEKIVFNVSEQYMANHLNIIQNQGGDNWLVEIVNSNKYVVEYAEPVAGEAEFFANYTFNEFGDVDIKTESVLQQVEITDAFLNCVKQIIGKSFDEININYLGKSDNNFKIIINISSDFILANNGKLPEISGGNVVELAESMKNHTDLIGILDKIFPAGVSNLVFNGTKQELVERCGALGLDYVKKLLFIEYSNFEEIHFSDGEILYGNITNKTVTYEDDRIKIVATYQNDVITGYTFEDKQNANISFTNTNGQQYGEDNGNSYGIRVRLYYYNPETSTYSYEQGGMTYNRNVIVPIYRFSIEYYYGHLSDGGFNYVYGNGDGDTIIEFKSYNLPTTIAIS